MQLFFLYSVSTRPLLKAIFRLRYITFNKKYEISLMKYIFKKNEDSTPNIPNN